MLYYTRTRLAITQNECLERNWCAKCLIVRTRPSNESSGRSVPNLRKIYLCIYVYAFRAECMTIWPRVHSAQQSEYLLCDASGLIVQQTTQQMQTRVRVCARVKVIFPFGVCLGSGSIVRRCWPPSHYSGAHESFV